MAIITVGSTALPSPSDMQVDIEDITNAERNANGNMIIERITTKRKINLSWKYLSAADTATVLSAVLTSPTFNVTYRDPVTNADRTAKFYCGGRSAPVIDYRSGVPRYKDIKFNLIEV